MAAVRTRKEKERRMKETACQNELALMLDKKKLVWSLIGASLEHAGYTIPMRSAWE